MKIFLDGDTENGQVLMDGVKEEEGSSVTYQFSRVQELGFWASSPDFLRRDQGFPAMCVSVRERERERERDLIYGF